MSKARDIADLDFNSPDIDGGNIDGAVIGATTRANGDFLAISASNTLTVANTNGYGTIEVGGSSGAFIDLKRPSSDDYDMRIVTDGGTGGRIDANGNIQINATNEAVFNENSADVDFRVESNGNANMIFVNAGSDVVSFGTTDTFPGDGDTNTGAAISASGSAAFSRDGFRVVSINRNNSDGTLIEFNKDGFEKGNIGLGSGNAYFSSTEFGIKPTSIGLLSTNTTGGAQNNLYDIGSNSYRWKDLYLSGTATVGGLTVDGDPALNGNVTITNTGTGAAAGPYLTLDRNSSSPADSDLLGILSFRGRDDGANVTDYGTISGKIADVTGGTEDGVMLFNVISGGSSRDALTLSHNESVFNNGSADQDFRVESNGNTHALFVNGANGNLSLGSSTSHGQLTLNNSAGSSDGLYIRNSNGAGLDLVTLGPSYNVHGATPNQVWLYSGQDINIGGATSNTNSVRILGGGAERMKVTSDGKFDFPTSVGGTGVPGNRIRGMTLIGDANSTGYNDDDGNWGSRLQVASTIHAKINVSQQTNAMKSHWFAHTGQDSIKFGTESLHDVEFQCGNSSLLELSYNGGNRRVDFHTNRIKFTNTAGGEFEFRTGGRNGTGTYTLFTNGSGVTQSMGIVEIMAIYGTPSTGAYRRYKITGNRNVYLIEQETTGYGGGGNPTLAWSGADLQVSNSNSSVYYHVSVFLPDIGNAWSPTWGNLPGIS